jgi:lipoprotein-anchoring transpeptidase ErfK/SrfK
MRDARDCYGTLRNIAHVLVRAAGIVVGLVGVVVVGVGRAAAEGSSREAAVVRRLVPPWTLEGEVPLPGWVRSVGMPAKEVSVFSGPSSSAARRGATAPLATFPVFAARRGDGCGGRWLLIGPHAWVCSDSVELLADEADSPARAARPPPRESAPLPLRHVFIALDTAAGYSDGARIGEDVTDIEVGRGVALAVVDERTVNGTRWLRARSGKWVRAQDVREARPSAFAGVELPADTPSDKTGAPPSQGAGPKDLDIAWVRDAGIYMYDAPNARARSKQRRDRREVLRVEASASDRGEEYLQVRSTSEASFWVRTRDVVRPQLESPPEGVDVDHGERWIDVDVSRQTLVAYEGLRPAFATLVSTGRGPQGSEWATPIGLHRIWVKLLSSSMAAGNGEEAEAYTLEDVPHVQYFDNGVALHATFWHDELGTPRSHGCVNLSPRDAAWLFAFTGPWVAPGYRAALPTAYEAGTWVRVRASKSTAASARKPVR